MKTSQLVAGRRFLALLGVSALISLPAAASAQTTGDSALFSDGFNAANGPNGLITNEYAAWHPTESGVVESPNWRSDGGSLFSAAVDGRQAAYTGKLDSSPSDKYSERYTDSNKMRFWTKAGDYDNARVEADIKPMAWDPAAPSTWGGFKFYLRRQVTSRDTTQHNFYTAEPNIKDGSIYIQKKCGGTYYLLAKKQAPPLNLGAWAKVSAKTQTNDDGSVTIGVYRDGVLQLSATDRGTGCAIHKGGAVGWRSDYFQYYIDDFKVSGV